MLLKEFNLLLSRLEIKSEDIFLRFLYTDAPVAALTERKITYCSPYSYKV